MGYRLNPASDSWFKQQSLTVVIYWPKTTGPDALQNAHWKLMDKNCATIVARVLKAGGADRFATRAKHQLVWWPTDLITYACSMGTQVVRTSDVVPAAAGG
jgi:hypothetical protein